jgi:hypothetical protein
LSDNDVLCSFAFNEYTTLVKDVDRGYYGLNMKWLLEAHVLNTWSRTGGAISRGGRNFGGLTLAGGSGSLGACL